VPSKMNRFKTYIGPALVAAALMVGALAAGQGQGQARGMGRRMGGFGGGNNSTFLLRRTDVQADLQLSADQKTKLDALMTSMRGNRGNRGAGGQGGQGGGTPPTDAERQARRAEMESQRAEMQKNVNAILTPAQTSRLKEISIQLSGNMAIMQDDVQSNLGLSVDQKAKVKSLQDKMSEASQSIFQKMQDNSITRDDAMKSFQKNGEVMKEELGKVLTRSQAEKLKSMGGAPFKADPSESQGFGGGFGRGGGRRGGGGGAAAGSGGL
jgi:hypothetical protein